MAELKTKPTPASVDAYIEAIEDTDRRSLAEALRRIMEDATGVPGRMWGASIVGFGDHHYVYASGREGDWFITGFSNRKAAMTLYVIPRVPEQADLVARMGKVKAGVGCIYVKQSRDVDLAVVAAVVAGGVGGVRG